ncbi:MAG: cell division protein ZipA, partial [Proteobacteria bacterium]
MSNWLTGIIVLLIIVILIDGFRRTWNARRNRLDVSPSLNKRVKTVEPEPEVDEAPPSYISELPNGGARVIGYREPRSNPKRKPSARELKEARRREEAAKRTPEQTRLNLDESVPILMESVESHGDDVHLQNPFDKEHSDRIEPTLSNGENEFEADSNSLSSQKDDDYEALEEDEYDSEDQMYHEDDAYDEDDYDDDAYEDGDYVDENETEDDYADAEEDAPVAATPQAEPEEVLIINIMAHKGEAFKGNELLDIVLKCGLRYGSMDIFHRYSDTKGEGALLFSMANMVKPGTFDLDAMDEFTTPGVSLFMTLPIDADSMQSFDLMAETAQAIAQTLGGELKDDQRSVM